MKNLILLFTISCCFLSNTLISQCDVELSITNESVSGNTVSFNIAMRSNIEELLLGDSDFIVIDGDGNSDFSGSVSISDNLLGAEGSGGGTTYTVNFSAPPAFSVRIGASNTTIAKVTISGYSGGPVELEWRSAIINYYDESNNNRQEAINSICFNDAARTLLPVELTYFDAQEIDNEAIQLDWETLSEIRNSGFEIQHSTNATNWQTLDFVPGKGTTHITQTYQFIHSGASYGDNYYRLKQIDIDGAFEYSDIESVNLEGSVAEFVVYPNPSSDTVNITIDKDEVEGQLQIMDLSGRTISTRTLDRYTNRYSLHLGDLPKGVYYLNLQVGSNIYTKKLVLQE